MLLKIIISLLLITHNRSGQKTLLDAYREQGVPRYVVISTKTSPPDSHYFLKERQRENGIFLFLSEKTEIEGMLSATSMTTRSLDRFSRFRLHIFSEGFWDSYTIFTDGASSFAGVEVDGNRYLFDRTLWEAIKEASKNSTSLHECDSNCGHGLRKFKGAKNYRFGKPQNGKAEVLLNKLAGFDIESEEFIVYIPRSYDGKTPHGVLVYICPVDDNVRYHFSPQWERVFEEKKLIWISAYKSGNTQDTSRRMRLALEARRLALLSYNIDPERIYVSGFSGGGRMCTILLAEYPEAFNGSIQYCGANSYERYIMDSSNPKKIRAGANASRKTISHLRKHNRFVLVSGNKDFNYHDTNEVYKSYKRLRFETLYIDIPGLSHEIPADAETMVKAIEFLDSRTGKTVSLSPAARELLNKASGLLEEDSPSKCRHAIEMLWEKYPEARNDSRVLELVDKVEKMFFSRGTRAESQ